MPHARSITLQLAQAPNFGALWVPKLGTCVSPSKVDKKDTTGQPVGDYMIGLLEDER